MTRRLRRAITLALLALGFLGLLASGSGLWPSSPWPWLAVLVLAVVANVAGDHYDQRQRLARRTEKRLAAVEAKMLEVQRALTNRIDAVREHVDTIGSPEGMKALVENVNRMASDLKPIKEQMDSFRTSGGLRAMMERR